MATDVEVTCINKNDRNDPHERIHGIGGVNSNGSKWYLPLDQAIAAIEDGKYNFYVMVNGKRVNVVIATHNGHKYLKTEADGIQENNLLSLPPCT